MAHCAWYVDRDISTLVTKGYTHTKGATLTLTTGEFTLTGHTAVTGEGNDKPM